MSACECSIMAAYPASNRDRTLFLSVRSEPCGLKRGLKNIDVERVATEILPDLLSKGELQRSTLPPTKPPNSRAGGVDIRAEFNDRGPAWRDARVQLRAVQQLAPSAQHGTASRTGTDTAH